MNYNEITVRTNSASSELVAYYMQEVCMDGVSVFDRRDLYENSGWDYKDDVADALYEDEVLVKGYCNLDETDCVVEYLKQNLAHLENAGSLKISVGVVDGDLWVEKWKETFRPIETEKIVICPEWQTVTTDKTVFLMDTGIAFGTGQHETTSMCLEFAEKMDLNGKTVLDVGCGSGILGLCALLLGAKSAELVDIDSQATEVAKHNAEINGLTNKCSIKTGSLTEKTNGTFDVVFANLTADILKLLYDQISAVVHSGTTVVLSGILDVKAIETESLFSGKFDVVERAAKGEWRALLLSAK